MDYVLVRPPPSYDVLFVAQIQRLYEGVGGPKAKLLWLERSQIVKVCALYFAADLEGKG